MSPEKPGKDGGNRILHCSFCGKSQREVKKLQKLPKYLTRNQVHLPQQMVPDQLSYLHEHQRSNIY